MNLKVKRIAPVRQPDDMARLKNVHRYLASELDKIIIYSLPFEENIAVHGAKLIVEQVLMGIDGSMARNFYGGVSSQLSFPLKAERRTWRGWKFLKRMIGVDTERRKNEQE